MGQDVAPGWYPDPLGRHEHRYFDGDTWSDHVSDRGIQDLDPVAATHGPSPAARSHDRDDVDDEIADAEIVDDDAPRHPTAEPRPVLDPARATDAAADLGPAGSHAFAAEGVDAGDGQPPAIGAGGPAIGAGDGVRPGTGHDPGWHPDPSGRAELRYFDGSEWGPYVARAGETHLDPEGTVGIATDCRPASPATPDRRRSGRRDEEKARRQAAKAAAGAAKDAEKLRRRNVRDAKARVKAAEKARSNAVREAQKKLDAARQARQVRINTATTRLRAAEDPHGRRVGAYQGIVLFERFISTPQGAGPIKGATATVDTAGNLAVTKRPTLTRMAAGGILLGPLGAVGSLAFQKRKDVDARELYLVVETEQFAAVVQCPPDQGMQARQFAAAIVTAARRFEADEPTRLQTIDWAHAEIAAANADTAAIDAAAQDLADVEADPSLQDAILTARNELAELSAPPAPQ
jgi:hypothetical protein